jgi:hypothetical protein
MAHWDRTQAETHIREALKRMVDMKAKDKKY